MRNIDTVFFDMGGTLETLSFDEARRRQASADLLAFLRSRNLNPNCAEDAFYTAVTLGLQTYRQTNTKSLDELPALDICTQFVLKDFEFPADALASICDEFMLRLEMSFYYREMRPEAGVVLKALQDRGYSLGIISNVMSKDCVQVNLARYGLLEYFDVLVASAVHGRRKPDPSIFLYACEQMGVSPDQCMHVGDKTSRDIVGARRAGFAGAVRIEHREVDGPEPDEPKADAVVRDLYGVLDLLPRRRRKAETGGCTTAPDFGSCRAVFFDAGDILYHRPRRGQHLSEFIRTHDVQLISMDETEQKAMKDRAMTGEITKTEYVAFRLRSMGVSDEGQLPGAIEAFLQDSDDVAFFHRSRETLEELKRRGYSLGIITDTYHSKDTKLEWLRRNGMDDLWDVFVSSSEEGVRKPHPRIYQTALHQLQLEPSQVAFVGHKKSELDGAKSVGIRTVAFNYEESAEADTFIQQFDELLTLFPSTNGKERE